MFRSKMFRAVPSRGRKALCLPSRVMALANLLTRILWNVLTNTDDTVIGRKSPGLEASSFFGIKIIFDSKRNSGILPPISRRFMILIRMLMETFRSCLDVKPSGPSAADMSGK